MTPLLLQILRRTQLAMVFAWVGLVPFMGLPFALASFAMAVRCRTLGRSIPNPARNEVRLAIGISLTGILTSIVLLGLLISMIVNRH